MRRLIPLILIVSAALCFYAGYTVGKKQGTITVSNKNATQTPAVETAAEAEADAKSEPEALPAEAPPRKPRSCPEFPRHRTTARATCPATLRHLDRYARPLHPGGSAGSDRNPAQGAPPIRPLHRSSSYRYAKRRGSSLCRLPFPRKSRHLFAGFEDPSRYYLGRNI